MTIRELLEEALRRPGQDVLISKSVIEAVLRELGPEPDIEGHQCAPVTSMSEYYQRYKACLDPWHDRNSMSYSIYPACPCCGERHPEPWKLQKIPGSGGGG